MARKDRGTDIERINLQAAGNAVAASQRARHGMRPEAARVLALGVAAVCLIFFAMILPTSLFTNAQVTLTLSTFLDRASNSLYGLIGVFTGNGEYFESRFMTVFCCAISGAALGLCGSAYQGAFNNPLAAPKTLGVMSGGALGALAWFLFFSQYIPVIPSSGVYTAAQKAAWLSSLSPWEWILTNYGKCLCSVAGCFLVVGIVMVLTASLGKGRLSNVIVIVFGQVFSAAATAIIAFARYSFTVDGDEDMAADLASIENYFMNSSYDYLDLLIIVLPLVVCMAMVLKMGGKLTLISFGDDEAASMGVNVNRTRFIMIALCTVMTGWAISFCGHVAFLGFISAHIARRIVGPDFRYLLPASIFVGSGFIVIVQWICQSGLPGTSWYATGVTCSIVGALIFLVIVLAQRGKGSAGGWR